jgi:hypothetical protein
MTFFDLELRTVSTLDSFPSLPSSVRDAPALPSSPIQRRETD